MLHCERQMLQQTTLWEELHRNVCGCVWWGFTVFYTLTLHSTHWHCILLYLPYFYCISLFQASVALMFTDLNLVLLLYYFIIALSRFLNLKWALCLIKSKLQVNGLLLFAVFFDPGPATGDFLIYQESLVYITKRFTINGQRNTKHFTKRNTKHLTINYNNEILFLQY